MMPFDIAAVLFDTFHVFGVFGVSMWEGLCD